MIHRKANAVIHELDNLCRELTFARDHHRCMKCGKPNRLQWCHVYSRRYRRLRWNLLNCMALCAGCHLLWHHRPLEAMRWFTETVGAEKSARLEMAARSKDTTKLDLEAVRLYLTQQLEKKPISVKSERSDP